MIIIRVGEAMDGKFLDMSLQEVKNQDSLLRGKRLSSHCLQYSSPSHGGWGIVRVGMLVPESVMLFIAPPACGRHGAIAGIQLGFKHRLFYLYLSEVDLVIGEHLELVTQAVAEIMATTAPRPRALTLCISCVDYLLGSDFDSIVKELEAEHGIPVRLSYMNPIAIDGKTPPAPNMQRTIYSFLPKPVAKDKGVNIIGSFVPVTRDSELQEVLARAGWGPLRHIGDYQTLEHFNEMSNSAYNLLIRPEGRLAAAALQEKLGIPFCYAPVAYGLETIAYNYRAIEALLGTALDTEWYRHEALRTIAKARAELGPLRLAVSSTANATPFELSRALTEFGFTVKYIFCDELIAIDEEHLDWMMLHSPDTRVLTNIHPGMPAFRSEVPPVDLAIGLAAGYYCNCKTVPLSLDIQPYGYRGISYLLDCMAEAWETPQDLKALIQKAAIVI